MSDRMRWRCGDTNPVEATVDDVTVIEIGDLVYQSSDNARPASAIVNETHKDTTPQRIFAVAFLGVAMRRSRSGDSDPIGVATTGVFEFDVPADLFELGDLIGVGRGPNGTPMNQQVELVEQHQDAIARVAKRVGLEGCTDAKHGAPVVITVLIDIRSTIMTGGVRGSVLPFGG